MTTICFCNNILAADSRITCDNVLISDTGIKLFNLSLLKDSDPILYLGDQLLAIALAGDCSDFDMYLSYLTSSDFPNNSVQHGCSGIVVGKEYIYAFYPNTGFLCKQNKQEKIAEGSGRDFALSAMSMGMSAIDAIKHARKLDLATGGMIRYIKF